MSDESDGPETVWVAARKTGSGQTRRLHFDRDCYRLQNAQTVLEKTRDYYPDDRAVCSSCAPEHEQQTVSGDLDRNERTVLEALEEADGPLPSRKIRTRIRVGRTGVSTSLRRLQARGIVKKTYGADARIPLYTLADGMEVDP